VLANLVQGTSGALQWREDEYRRLRAIHAGYDLSFVQNQLGAPAQVNEVGDTDFTERIFVRRDHFVQVVSSSSGRVVLYSVVSCDEDFRPTFDAEPSTEVQLQDMPLSTVPVLDPEVAAEREAATVGGTHLFDDDFRRLQYQAPSTVSTPENYVEWTGPSSNSTQLRAYFVGVNPLCVGSSQHGALPHQSYVGDVAGAPHEVRQFRQNFAANMYAETVDPLLPELDHLGMIVIPRGEYEEGCDEVRDECVSVTVGPFGFDLPPSLLGQGSTRQRQE
jgi:hypothetical protein